MVLVRTMPMRRPRNVPATMPADRSLTAAEVFAALRALVDKGVQRALRKKWSGRMDYSCVGRRLYSRCFQIMEAKNRGQRAAYSSP